MKGLADAALLAAVAMGSVLGASALGQASWPRRSPAAAILLWQALGLGVARSVLHVGTVFRAGGASRLPAGFGAMPAILVAFRVTCLAAGLALLASLCWVLLAASAAALQARRRQRA